MKVISITQINETTYTVRDTGIQRDIGVIKPHLNSYFFVPVSITVLLDKYRLRELADILEELVKRHINNLPHEKPYSL